MFKVHALFMSPSENQTIVISSSPKKVVGGRALQNAIMSARKTHRNG